VSHQVLSLSMDLFFSVHFMLSQCGCERMYVCVKAYLSQSQFNNATYSFIELQIESLIETTKPKIRSKQQIVSIDTMKTYQ
jgi:predicted enzyme involved in methoxymalonyl-ACP biosynthesis